MSCNAAVPTAAVQISEAGTTIVQVIPVCGVTLISGAVTLSIVSTTQTSSSTSSGVSTNTLTSIQTSSSSSSVSKSSSSSSVSISSVSIPTSSSSAPASSSFVPTPSSRSLPLGAIIGVPLVVLAVLSFIIIFLLFKLKRRRETRLQGGSPALASVTPFEFSVAERPVSDESRSATRSPLTFTTPTGAASPVPNTYNTRGKHSRTPGSLATTSSSDLNSNPIPPNISDDLNATRTHRTLSYVVSNPIIQPASTNDPDRAPPAYDTLTNRGPGPVVLPSTTTSSTTTKAVTAVTSISTHTVTLTTSLVNPSISSVSTLSVQIPVPASISSGPTPISSSPISISSSPVSISPVSISLSPISTSSALGSTSSASTSSFVVSASSVSAPSSSRSLPLGAIIGAPLAALALLVLIIVFLFFKLKRRRETLLEVDPPVVSVTPFESSIRERPQGDHVSMATTPTGTPVTPLAPNSITSDGFTSDTSPTSPGKYGARTPGTLATTSSSDLNPNPNSNRLGHFQSNISNNDFNAARAPLTLSYVSNSTDIYDDTLDSAPPAYDSLTNRISHINSSQLKS